MVFIRQKLVSALQATNVTNGKNNKKKYIVVHETDNTNVGADADAHARLQFNGNSRVASWHWQVDDHEAVQSFDHDWECFAAGTHRGNTEGIQIEICVNSDGDYHKAIENAASLVAKIMKDENIAIQYVVQHHYFSGKNCPRNIRAGKIAWSTFLQMVTNIATLQPEKPPTESLKYRIITGTYSTRNTAMNVLDVMKKRFGWVAYIEQEGTKYRVKTGTFTGLTVAKNAENKIKTAKLAQVTHIIAA